MCSLNKEGGEGDELNIMGEREAVGLDYIFFWKVGGERGTQLLRHDSLLLSHVLHSL